MEEDFDLDIAIEDKGSCLRQNTSCTNCFLGKLLYQHGHKAHLEDLCEHDLVFMTAKGIKNILVKEGEDGNSNYI